MTALTGVGCYGELAMCQGDEANLSAAALVGIRRCQVCRSRKIVGNKKNREEQQRKWLSLLLVPWHVHAVGVSCNGFNLLHWSLSLSNAPLDHRLESPFFFSFN